MKAVGLMPLVVFILIPLNFTLIKLNIPKLISIIFQDIKNAELALFELNRVINLAPDHPEVFEQRAEVLFLF